MNKSQPAINLEEYESNVQYQDDTRIDDDITDDDECDALISSDKRKLSPDTKKSKASSRKPNNLFSNKAESKGQTSQKQEKNRKDLSPIEWVQRLFTLFDRSYMWVMTVSYFIQGFKVFIDLSVMDLFKQYLKLEPAEMQVLTSIINMPWSLKVFYGLIADNVPIYGSKRRSYIAINGFLQFVFLMPLVPDLIYEIQIYHQLFPSHIITFFLTLYAVNVAFNDSIIDALMVMQARRDPVNGSQDLNSYSWIWLAFGGITGSISAGFLTQYLNPHTSFLICGLLGLSICLLGFLMNKDIDKDGNREIQQGPNKQDFRRNMVAIKKALKTPQIYKTLTYFVLCGLLVPRFGDVSYFFQLNVLGFSKMTYSLLTLVSFVSLLFGTMVYNKYFQDWEFRSLLQLAQLCCLFGATCNLILVLRWNTSYINDLAFVFFTNIISDTMSLAFSYLPTVVLFTKITPYSVEATIFATLTGAYNFAQNVGGPLLGSLFCHLIGVDSQHLDRYYLLIMIQILAISFTFFYKLIINPFYKIKQTFSFKFIWFVPTKADINKAQQEQIKEHEEEERMSLLKNDKQSDEL